MIKLEAIGHLGKDATVNTVGNTKVINFSICHTEKFKDAQGEQKTKSIWIECSKWGDNTAVAAYLKQGGQVYISGIPEIRTYPKNDGTTGTSLSCRIFDLQLLGGNRQDASPAQEQTEQKTTQASQPAKTFKPVDTGGGADDLPF